MGILANTLSIENGDLTPNLKLKHNVVSQKYQKSSIHSTEAPFPKATSISVESINQSDHDGFRLTLLFVDAEVYYSVEN